MPYSVGAIELLAVVAVVVPTIVMLFAVGYARCRWLVAASICLTIVAVITPADLLSTCVLSMALFAVLLLGSRMRLLDAAVAE